MGDEHRVHGARHWTIPPYVTRGNLDTRHVTVCATLSTCPPRRTLHDSPWKCVSLLSLRTGCISRAYTHSGQLRCPGRRGRVLNHAPLLVRVTDRTLRRTEVCSALLLPLSGLLSQSLLRVVHRDRDLLSRLPVPKDPLSSAPTSPPALDQLWRDMVLQPALPPCVYPPLPDPVPLPSSRATLPQTFGRPCAPSLSTLLPTNLSTQQTRIAGDLRMRMRKIMRPYSVRSLARALTFTSSDCATQLAAAVSPLCPRPAYPSRRTKGRLTDALPHCRSGSRTSRSSTLPREAGAASAWGQRRGSRLLKRLGLGSSAVAGRYLLWNHGMSLRCFHPHICFLRRYSSESG